MMGWAAGVFGGGGAVLVLGCAVGMGLLMWLLVRLTGDSSAHTGVRRPRRVVAEHSRVALTGAAAPAQPRPGSREQAPSGPAGSGSVAP